MGFFLSVTKIIEAFSVIVTENEKYNMSLRE